MFKVLIVDDERLDREGLRNQVEWCELNITGVDTAKNGFEAIGIITERKPDILITDVKMPGMNGLCLAQKAAEIVPWIKIIFISGFDDFEFVKNALLINAYEYILKPVDTDELLTALKKVVSERIREKKAEEENLLMISKVNESKPLLKNKFIREVIYGTIANMDTIWKNINLLNLNIQDGLYRVLTCELDDCKILSEELSSAELEAVQGKILDVLGLIETDGCLIESIQAEQSRFVVVLNFLKRIENTEIDNISKRIAGLIIDKVKNLAGMSMTIGLGSVIDAVEDLHYSYDDSCRALNQKMLMGKGSVLQFFPRSNIKDSNIDIQNISNELMQCIRISDINKVNHLLDYLFDSLEAGSFYGSKYVQNCCINIISRIEITLLEMNEKMENIFGENVILWDKLMKFETILDIRQWMKNVFKAVLEYFEVKNSRKNRKVIKLVMKYIEENYFKELTLKDIAAEFFYSPNHLGAIFKEESGMGFTEYLTEYRMKQAAELLQQPCLKMYEIANRVGYKNISSFINQFKTTYKMTPTEFRDRC